MKKYLVLIPAVLLLAGCDANAIHFAEQTNALLQEYQKKINDQISQTTSYYTTWISLSSGASWRQLNDTLAVERDERSTELAADYLEGRKPASLYRSHLRPYAQLEYDQRRQWLSADVDGSLPYLKQLASLDADKDNIEALSKILQGLAKPRSLLDEAKDLQSFVAETKKDFDGLVCADLKTKKDAADAAAKTAAAAQAAELKSQSSAIAQLQTDRHCSAQPNAAASSGAGGTPGK